MCDTSVASALLQCSHTKRRDNMKRELLNGLTEDQIAKVAECDNVSDLIQLAKDEGVELTEEQLEAVSGGACSSSKEEKDTNGKRKIES